VTPAQPGAAPQEFASKFFRSVDGKSRFDYGNTSIITNPAMQQTTILDHLTKEFRVVPTAVPGAPQLNLPGMPRGLPGGLPGPPQLPNMYVQDLGRRLIDGVEMQGKRFTLPSEPQLPNIPPNIAEVWTSTKGDFPVLTKISGRFGEQICHCKSMLMGQPPATMFQVPPDYKPVAPPTPTLPPAPARPKFPGL
jgi:hypothetical protein